MITRCEDSELIRLFMTLPEVYRYAAESGVDKDTIEFKMNTRNIWLIYGSGDDGVGLISFHIESGCMAEFHPYILRDHKDQYDTMVQEFFDWFKDFAPIELVKLNAWIPEVCKGAILAAERANMTREGLDRKSWLSDKGPCDRILFGITREELE